MRYLLLLIFVGLLSVGLWAAEPGSPKDPVITRSYLETLYSWQYLNVAEGQTMSLDMGSMIVLRTGKAEVVGQGDDGLVDLTEGKELGHGQVIPLNHLILSPASDRRGLKALTPVVAMTRGLSK